MTPRHLPIALLLATSVALVWQAGAVMRYTQATANALHAPSTYVHAVMTTPPVPDPPRANVPALQGTTPR